MKLGVLALLYLFFARVMWAVWSELRTPASPVAVRRVPRPARRRAPRPSAAGAGAARAADDLGQEPVALVVVEPVESAGHRFELGGGATIGRSPDCDLVIDDTYVSGRHARIQMEDGAAVLEDLGSTNGTLHNGSPVHAPVPLVVGDRLRLGSTLLEVR